MYEDTLPSGTRFVGRPHMYQRRIPLGAKLKPVGQEVLILLALGLGGNPELLLLLRIFPLSVLVCGALVGWADS